MDSRPVVVKWKYKSLSPTGKPDPKGNKSSKINNYIDYIEKQAEERRQGSSFSSIQDMENAIGGTKHDDELIREMEQSEDKATADQGKYLRYINERKGSRGCFSSENANVDELMKELKHHEGYAWIPIVSLKEDWAKDYGLDTEAAWMGKARELAELYRQQLGIEPENYSWVAAFHTKPEEDQNSRTDAGGQPHLHFIIWEKNPQRRYPTLSPDKCDNVRILTANALSREYMAKSYERRNELRDLIQRGSVTDIGEFMDEVKQLVIDIRTLTGGKGKLTMGELEKRVTAFTGVYQKLRRGEPLNGTEQYYADRYEVHDTTAALRAVRNYTYVLDEINGIVKAAVARDDVTALLYEWYNLSMNMRSAQGDELAQKTTYKDYGELKRVIANSILNEVKGAAVENTYISDELKGVMIDRLENGVIRKDIGLEDLIENTEVISTLCKAVGLPEASTDYLLLELAKRSDKLSWFDYMEKKNKEVYAAAYFRFNVTSRDFYSALRNIQTEKPAKQFFTAKANPYKLAESSLLAPIANSIMDEKVTSLFSNNRERLQSLFSDYSTIKVNDRESFADKYQSLCDMFASATKLTLDERAMQHGDELQIQI